MGHGFIALWSLWIGHVALSRSAVIVGRPLFVRRCGSFAGCCGLVPIGSLLFVGRSLIALVRLLWPLGPLWVGSPLIALVRLLSVRRCVLVAIGRSLCLLGTLLGNPVVKPMRRPLLAAEMSVPPSQKLNRQAER